MDNLVIDSRISIPLSELTYRFSRASGAGGQHVNKNETAVELLFDLAHTPHLAEDERQRAMSKLRPYLDKDGVLHLESQASRSQLKNREEVTRRFAQLLREALVAPKKRKKSRPTRGSVERRLQNKKRVSQIKRLRGQRNPTHSES